MASFDVYTEVTNQIVAQIEAGAGKWQMPWHGNSELPVNVTGRRYSGGNVLFLWAAAKARGYDSPVWGTFKQWHERGAQVRKGEKSSLAYFMKKMLPKGASEDDDDAKAFLMARAYHVFNAAQVDGWTPPAEAFEKLTEEQRVAAADAYMNAIPAKVIHGGNEAFYRPSADEIHLPPFERFHSPEDYYATRGHESIHWTKQPHRCDREFSKRFGDDAYAFEELVAELGASFLCAKLGIENEPRADHAAYLTHWLKVLKNDKKAIFTAASKAQ